MRYLAFLSVIEFTIWTPLLLCKKRNYGLVTMQDVLGHSETGRHLNLILFSSEDRRKVNIHQNKPINEFNMP